MPIAKPEISDARVIAHIDMDCFYVQVEQRKRPELRGLPTAVVQYNSWKGGALIAVGYEARKFGIKRSMRGEEAKSACPEIQLVQVPVAHNKADLNSYRDAGSEVVVVLSKMGRCERASIDEVYLDLTEAAETMLAGSPLENSEAIEDEALKSHILGLSHEDVSDAKENVRRWLCRSDAHHHDKLLACGALIVADLRIKVLKETEFTCSAGIAHNKMLAKLASAMNKPAQQTVVPSSSVEGLLYSFPIRKMKQLGGKLGSSLQSDMGINTVGDLLQYSKQKLQDRFGINTGAWLWNIARGIDGEDVQGRLLPKSHGSGKTFPGPQTLKTISSVQQWLNELCEELHERLCSDLKKNKRMAQTLTLHARAYKPNDPESENKFPSKSCPLRYGTSKIQEDALNLFQAGLREYMGSSSVKTQGTKCSGWGITGISVSASKIVSMPSGTHAITKYFSGSASGSKEEFTQGDVLLSSTGIDRLAGCDSSEIEIPGHDTLSHGKMEEDRETFTDQLSNFFGRTTSTDQAPSGSSTKDAQDCVTPETSVCLTKGTENCSTLEQVEKKQDCSAKEYTSTYAIPNHERKGHKRNTSKDKVQGIPSILRFFKHDDGGCSSQLDQVKASQGRNDYGLEAWMYKIDEIDNSVLDELPPEIREEVQAWLQPRKKANTVDRKSNITHYFAPSRST